jgi:LysM repeat protein
MSHKKFLQIILLLAVVVSTMGFTTSASAAYSCGTSYTVSAGNTLSQIAQTCGTSIAAIQLANPGLGKYIYAGQVLTLPGAFWDNGNGYATYVVSRGDTLKALAIRFGTSVDTLGSLNSLVNYNLIYEGQRLTVPSGVAVPVPPPPSSSGTYTIQSGDTLRKIAARINSTVKAILAVNPQITDANKIYAGYQPAGQRDLPYGAIWRHAEEDRCQIWDNARIADRTQPTDLGHQQDLCRSGCPNLVIETHHSRKASRT